MRILLIVDDEPDLAAMLRRFLKRDFDEILEARDRRRAEELVSARPVTHLVLDAALPDGPAGAEVVRRWRALAPSLGYAAIFSGQTPVGVPAQGVDAVFAKPDGLEDLLAALRRRTG